MKQQMNIRYFKRNYSSRTIGFVLFFFFNLLGYQTALGQIILQNDASGINTSLSSKLTVCNGGVSSDTGILFTDDGSNDGNYADNHTRIDTVEICPTDNAHYVRVTFTDFDIELADTLGVYQGDLVAVRQGLGVDGVATGVGVSNAFGGWVSANCNAAINPSGCLTFILRTDGLNTKGSGWEARADCAVRLVWRFL